VNIPVTQHKYQKGTHTPICYGQHSTNIYNMMLHSKVLTSDIHGSTEYTLYIRNELPFDMHI
jgi:hypothetical protein